MNDLWEFLLARIAEDRANLPTSFVNGISPARFEAECEAKEEIIKVHQHVFREGDGNLIGDTWECICCGTEWWCKTIKAVGSVYADHPGFHPQWAWKR